MRKVKDGWGCFRRVAGLVAASIVLSACSFDQVPSSLEDPGRPRAAETGRAVADDRPLKPTVKWRNCGQRFDCATVRVPLDYRRPKGATTRLALIRLPAPKHADRIGSLIVNPGGPGGSGVDFVRHGAVETVPAEVRARFDIVGFDPRGVGRSQGLSCGDQPADFLAQDFIPDGAGDLQALLGSAQALASACAAANPEMLPHMSTDDVARDLDEIRRAVGDRQLTYLGFSYGSTIGLNFAEQFPGRVRAMVLDGPVDPSIDGLQRAHDQAGVLERTLQEFFKVCSRDRACRGYAGKITLERYDALLGRLTSSPVPAIGFPGGSLHSSEALVASAALLKDRGTGWPLLAAGIAAAEAGDGSLLLSVAQSTMFERRGREQWLAPLLSVNCLDIPSPSPAEYPSAVEKLKGKSRHFGALMLLLSSPCSYWEVPPQRTPAPVRAKGAPLTVVIGTTGDPTTPYHWARAVARDLSSARLLTRDGAGHTAFGKRNVCTDRSVGTFLIHLAPPDAGTSCG